MKYKQNSDIVPRLIIEARPALPHTTITTLNPVGLIQFFNGWPMYQLETF